MLQVQQGQCGLCVHLGEKVSREAPKLIQIRLEHQAPDDLVESCGLPSNRAAGPRGTPISGCHGVEAAPQA